MTLRKAIFLAGAGVYAASFFLPAVGTGNGGMVGNELEGWVCAWFALFHGWSWEPSSLLLVAAGLVNPAVLLYAALRLFDRPARLRRAAAFCAIACLAASWIFLEITHAVVLAGHFAWDAGVLMMVGAEVQGIRIKHGDDLQASGPDSF
jgi:hypothetical protein